MNNLIEFYKDVIYPLNEMDYAGAIDRLKTEPRSIRT